MNSNCITNFFWFFLFYLPLSWYTRYRNVEGKTGRCEAIKPNFKKSKIGRKKWDGFIVTEQLLKKSTAVFAVNILCCEYILISVVWSWMCFGPRTAGLGSRGWRSLFKYLYREEDKAWNCYENSSLHVSKDRLTVQGFTRTTPWRYLNNWHYGCSERCVHFKSLRRKLPFQANPLEGIFIPFLWRAPSPLSVICKLHSLPTIWRIKD